jgi:hypothetical protein
VPIYGEGDVRSPHFLSAPMTLIELWRMYPRIVGPHDIAKLVETGQIVWNSERDMHVEPPKKVEAVMQKPKKGRGKKR